MLATKVTWWPLLHTLPRDTHASTDVVGQHRVLLFVQEKRSLDIIENELFKRVSVCICIRSHECLTHSHDDAEHMPHISYLRMDGSTPTHMRHDVQVKFNNDPSIDVLLLTTHVGGLGLNLTGLL